MANVCNKIKNPDFTLGQRGPVRWNWIADGANGAVPIWQRDGAANGQAQPTMTLRSGPRPSTGGWKQRMACQPGQFLRMEVCFSGDCGSDENPGGVRVALQPLVDGEAVGAANCFGPFGAVEKTTTFRTYYQVPEGVRRLDFFVGLEAAAGHVRLHRVAAIPIEEPEAVSHVLAVPPPPCHYPVPKTVRTVCVCDGQEHPALLDFLGKRFGSDAVRAVGRTSLGREVDADALLIPGPTPPTAMRSLAGLTTWARDRIVIVSLPALARLSRGAIEVRRVVQDDDPLNATVRHANFITRGFALQDILPWAWSGRDGHAFVQQHLRPAAKVKAWAAEHGFVTVLHSETTTDATSGKPVCLCKPTTGGCIVAADVEPIAVDATTTQEADLVGHVLLNMLGAERSGLGQYVVPPADDRQLRLQVDELSVRYPEFTVHERLDHKGQIAQQVVELGGRDRAYGLPLPRRPLIVIRTGLRGDDLSGLYGAMLWLKQLVRPTPFLCPYLSRLLGRFRLAWLPWCVPFRLWGTPSVMSGGDGRTRGANGDHRLDALPDAAPTLINDRLPPDDAAAVIDVTSADRWQPRVLVSGPAEVVECIRGELPRLATTFGAGGYFFRAPAPGAPIHDRSSVDWRRASLVPCVESIARPFARADETGHRSRRATGDAVSPPEVHTDGQLGNSFCRGAMAEGAVYVRLEIPDPAGNMAAHSIWRTDLAATLLEHVVGLLYGRIAVNRSANPVSFGNRTLAPGEAICDPGSGFYVGTTNA